MLNPVVDTVPDNAVLDNAVLDNYMGDAASGGVAPEQGMVHKA